MSLFPIRRKTVFDAPKKSALYGALLAFIGASNPALAALTDIAGAPLASSSTAAVKPNILFVLDDSGSMGWTHMPDNVETDATLVGYKNFRCNTIYYNPSTLYVPPKNPDGTNFANASFTAAKFDGYSSTSTTVNLSTAFQAYNDTTSSGNGTDTAQAAYYYLYSGTQTLTPHLSPCTQTIGTSPFAATGGGTWTKVIVGPTSGPSASDEQQNFANWYSYYRLRIYMMKAAASRAFAQLSSSYRVGFITINPGSPVTTSKYLAIADFDATQKTNWFNKLFSQTVGNSTPLREALSRAGRHYAGKQDGINNGMSGDPMQYSCQQNFTILTTDGYWNGNGGVKLDGTTAMDNQDGDIAVAPRPMYDGATAQSVTTDKWNNYRYSTSGCSSPRKKIQVRTWTIQTTQNMSGGVPVGSPTTTTTFSGFSAPSWLDSACRNPAVPLPASDAGIPASITQTSGHTYRRANSATLAGEQPAPTAGCTAWPCSSTTTSGGSSDSLADVAQYYYNTDLRPDGSLGSPVGSPAAQNDVGTGGTGKDVPAAGTGPEDDKAPWQHMTTFTMGLGLSGTINYQENYKTATSGDFTDIRNGAKNWPVPAANAPTALDDLWHAAVDGRGQFFSASDPDSVVNGLLTALAGISARIASAAAAATSNLEPVAGDNFAYVAKYKTQAWTGEVEAHEIDLTTGTVIGSGTDCTPGTANCVWSAQAKLDAKTKLACDNRSIKLFRSGATDNLVDFTWDSSACDPGGLPTGAPTTALDASEQANFSSAQVATFSHFASMTDGTSGTVNQRAAAAGANLVNFLRGQRGKESFSSNDITALYRTREHVLGDIVNAQPVYVKAPFAEYTDTGYAGFKSANSGRTAIVYVAANDGMLHAFFAGTSVSDTQGGEEAWAVIPSMVLPNLYKLADFNYPNLHTFQVDGTPTVGDIFDTAASAWKTILVAGLNAGGKGYYALDVTDPAAPKGLWEFKYSATCYDPSSSSTHSADCHLGLTFGNPIITKLRDGTWVVMVTSGYNNVNSPPIAGDGVGYLYVLEAKSGRILHKISTGAGNATTPSGLSKINSWVDDTIADNTAQRVYGVDLLGNVWRFDVNDVIDPAGREATLLATAKDASGAAQPITTKPELAEFGSPPSPFVYVATGRYLGITDIPATGSTPQTQTVYAIKDPLTTSAYSDLRLSLKHQTITNVSSPDGLIRTVACPTSTGNCTSTDGWLADLPDSGERVNVDMKLQLGTLVVASNVPQNTACLPGGYSWLNFFDFRTGGAISTSTGGSVGMKLSSSLAVGINIVRLPSGKTVVIATTSDAQQKTVEAPFDVPPVEGKRISWREIVQ